MDSQKNVCILMKKIESPETIFNLFSWRRSNWCENICTCSIFYGRLFKVLYHLLKRNITWGIVSIRYNFRLDNLFHEKEWTKCFTFSNIEHIDPFGRSHNEWIFHSYKKDVFGTNITTTICPYKSIIFNVFIFISFNYCGYLVNWIFCSLYCIVNVNMHEWKKN